MIAEGYFVTYLMFLTPNKRQQDEWTRYIKHWYRGTNVRRLE